MPARAERAAAEAGGADSGFAFEDLPHARAARSLAQRLISGTTPSRERARSFRVLGGARLVMGSILLGWFVLNLLSGGGHGGAGIAMAALYVVVVLGQWMISLRTTRGFAWQVLSAVLADLFAFTVLQWIAGRSAQELLLSYTLPVLAAGVWGTLRFTLATAALVSLLLLAQALAGLSGWHAGGELQLLASGFVGVAYFAMGILAWQLSQRLVRQEQRARSSELRASRQLAINRHVLLEHPDGVLVLDGRMRVEAANPAATNLLGMPGTPDELAPGAWDLSNPALAVLGDAVRRLAGAGTRPGSPLQFESIDGVRLQARVQPLRHLPGGPAYVVFVQDMRDIGNQIQQDKLAALGRLVAALAHEIRNPLGAIAHANELAAEHGLSETQRLRMSELISQNVDRLNRIVEDVLDLGRAGARSPVTLQPMRLLREVVAEFDAAIPGRIVLDAEDAQATLEFDPQQLRRVVVNLLGNAQRFASREPAAIRVTLRGTPRVRELAVANDGPVVAPTLRTQIFEPFFTTDSRGTGLGLYICQELCSRYGARLFYRVVQRGQAQGEFVIGVVSAPQDA